MPNHVHLVLVPSTEDRLCCTLGMAHRRYARRINFRQRWRGHPWQERFHSFVMDEPHLRTAVRYVECKPVLAQLVETVEQWPANLKHSHLVAMFFGHQSWSTERSLLWDL